MFRIAAHTYAIYIFLLQQFNWRQKMFFFCDFFAGIGPKKPMQITSQSATGHNSCPICGIQLSPDELEQHFSTELGRLAKPNMYNERQEMRRTLSMELHAVQSSLQSRTSRWEVRNCLKIFNLQIFHENIF